MPERTEYMAVVDPKSSVARGLSLVNEYFRGFVTGKELSELRSKAWKSFDNGTG